jgi:hypothetical protein
MTYTFSDEYGNGIWMCLHLSKIERLETQQMKSMYYGKRNTFKGQKVPSCDSKQWSNYQVW